MTVVVLVVLLVLILVAIVALVVDELRRRKRAPVVAVNTVVQRVERATQESSVGPPAEAIPDGAPIGRASDPVPIERAQRMSPGGDIRPKARKAPATKQTVLDELKRSGPSTSRDLAAKFAGATPTTVAGVLVQLRGDGKVRSERKRNLQVWAVAS